MPKLNAEVAAKDREIKRAESLVNALTAQGNLPRQHIAELILLRLFSLFEEIVTSAACKLISGSNYYNGTAPTLLRPRPTRGRETALRAMMTFRRADARRLRWGKASEIKRNVEHLLPPNEHFVFVVDSHAHLISEMRKIRNHVAHGTRGTYDKYKHVVRSRYGALAPAVTPGVMLVSPRFSPILIKRYMRETDIVLKTLMRSP